MLHKSADSGSCCYLSVCCLFDCLSAPLCASLLLGAAAITEPELEEGSYNIHLIFRSEQSLP